MIKKTEQRYRELVAMGIDVKMVCVGRKGVVYFKRRPQYTIVGERACVWVGWGWGGARCRQAVLAPAPADAGLVGRQAGAKGSADGGGSARAPPPAPHTLTPPPLLPSGNFEVGQSPTIKEAQAIADEIFADFVAQV